MIDPTYPVMREDLKRLMKEKGFKSARALAGAINGPAGSGTGYRNIGLILEGKTRPRESTLQAIAEKLDVEWKSLVDWTQAQSDALPASPPAASQQSIPPAADEALVPTIVFRFDIALTKKAWMEKRPQFLKLADEITLGQPGHYSISAEKCLDC